MAAGLIMNSPTNECVGFFIAFLDIQIVCASLRDIGGGLR
jgi:hypothetical protein